MHDSGVLDREERRQKAQAARERFYGHQFADAPTVNMPKATIRPGAVMIAPEKPRCRQNEGWLRGLASKAITFAKVLTSGDVPDEIYRSRMMCCESCEHASTSGGHCWCGCCGCPQWRVGGISSALEYKNRKSAWQCPGPDAFFGPYEGAGEKISQGV